MAGEEGFEPSNAGIKIRCLNQLGDSPSCVQITCPIVAHAHRSGWRSSPRATNPRMPAGNCGVQRRAPRLRVANSANTHAPDPSCAPADNVVSATRGALPPRDSGRTTTASRSLRPCPEKKGGILSAFRTALSTRSEDFLRGNRDLRRRARGTRRGADRAPCSRSPMPSPRALRPRTKNGTSAPELGPERQQVVRVRDGQLPQPVQREQHRRRVGAAAAQAAAHRKLLLQLDVGPLGGVPVSCLEQPRRAHAQVVLAGDARQPRSSPSSRSREADAVGAVDQPEHGLQQVVAVGAAPTRMCRKRFSFAGAAETMLHFHCEIARRSSTPG